MVLLLDDNSEIDTQMWSEIDNSICVRRGHGISVRAPPPGGRDFLGPKLFAGIRNKTQEKRYKTNIVYFRHSNNRHNMSKKS